MNFYLLFKSIHLIAVISWMAGLLYLPRIFVYHVENIKTKETTIVFEIMEKRLYFYIMRPAMILTWLFGFILIYKFQSCKNILLISVCITFAIHIIGISFTFDLSIKLIQLLRETPIKSPYFPILNFFIFLIIFKF